MKLLPDDYQCMICTKLLKEPHLTDCCGQRFCQACLEQWFKKQAKKMCPHCRSETFTHIRDLPLKRKIDVLEVYCPNQAEGCEKIMKLGALDDHKNECGFAKVKCPRGCQSVDEIKRKDLKKHAEVCPLEEVQCPFSEAGCDASILRKDLNAHIETSCQEHLMKMTIAYNKLKEELKQTAAAIIEPVKLASGNNRFSFIITSSKGWISPPFCVPGGYKFCIKHKEGKMASLVLFKGKHGEIPMYSYHDYKLVISHTKGMSVIVPSMSMRPQNFGILPVFNFNLDIDVLERTAVDGHDKVFEVDCITMPEEELLSSSIIVTLELLPKIFR